MRISFDLDDTLICYDPTVPCEVNRVPWGLRTWFNEPLRQGTVELMKQLQEQGWDIWIYTASYRSPQAVKRWFKFYGIEIAAVINQELHDKHVGRNRFEKYVSKYPPAFQIDLHVDDLEGAQEEGELHGFDVVLFRMDDINWTQRVLEAATRKTKICEN